MGAVSAVSYSVEPPVGVASGTTPGGIVLAGDLAGTGSVATAPRVGSLTGVSNVVVVRGTAALAFNDGANVASGGYLRFPAASGTIAVARNNANTDNVLLLGTNASDEILIGGTASTAFQATTTRVNGSTSVALTVGAAAKATVTTSALTLATGVALALPGTVATTGQIRTAHTSDVIVFRNASGSDAKLLAVDATNNINIGETGASPNVSGVYLNCVSSGVLAFSVGGTLRLRVTGSDIQARGVPIVFQTAAGTGNVAGVGDIRAQNNTTIVAARNAANTANIPVVGTDNLDRVAVNGGNAHQLIFYSSTAGSYGYMSGNNFQWATANTSRVTMGASALTLETNVQLIVTTASLGIKMGGGAGAPTITSGAGAPAAAEANGSIYMRTDGAPDQTLYVRSGGAWSPVVA